MFASLYSAGSINHQLFMLLNQAHSPVLDAVMPVFTYLGGSWAIYVYIPLLMLLSLVNRELMPRQYVWIYCVATVLSVLLEEQLKAFFHIPRPGAAIGLEHINILGEIKLKNSFPSGHAVFAFMTAYVLSHNRSWPWKTFLFGFALLTAYQRIYVGAHYPLDVAGGALVGSFSGWIVWQGYTWLARLRKNRTSH